MFNGLRLLLVIVLVQGCPLTAADKPSPADKALADAKPDFTFTAEAWHGEFKKDEAAARTKYLDKVVELKGVVSSVHDQKGGFLQPALSYIYLEVPNALLGVRCDCKPADLWKTVMPGSTTTVRGKYTVNSRLKGELYPCVLIKTDSKPVTVSATTLAAEVEKDSKAADQKYNDKWIFVEGKFKALSVDSLGVTSVTLESSDKVSISCGIPADEVEPLKALKPGQAVRCSVASASSTTVASACR